MIWEGPNGQGDSSAQKHQPDNKLVKNDIDILLFYMGCTFTLVASDCILGHWIARFCRANGQLSKSHAS